MSDTTPRDHGGGLDAAIARYGGARADWLDLSTGINPVPYPVGALPADAWTALPDSGAMDRLLQAARRFWQVPDGARIVAAPGASALIALMPQLTKATEVHIPGPTYNEHAAAFRAADRQVTENPSAPVRVHVHPNNPDGRLCPPDAIADRALTVIDESFCDVAPGESLIAQAAQPSVIVLKSFGKFWGLAGMRLGFAMARPETLTPPNAPGLDDLLGPWAVSGPALAIGAAALADTNWAEATRQRLADDADRLDSLITPHGAHILGGTALFRLYEVGDAVARQQRLAKAHIWSRIFPYAPGWLRLGLPPPDRWHQLASALTGAHGTAGGAMPPAASADPSSRHPR